MPTRPGPDSDLSRAVSHALRHEPWLYELELDNEGRTPVAALVEALRREPRFALLTEGDLERMVRETPKPRHELVDGKIRAMYGHSMPGRIEVRRASPPRHLFHGTSRRSADSVGTDGLRPMSRQFVHLSVDADMARAVGRRKDSWPIVLVVEALDAEQDGVAFYVGNEQVWLADAVPPRYVSVEVRGPGGSRAAGPEESQVDR